jgi:hypothetical protein
MKRISFKFIIGFLAFILGVLGTTIWLFNPFPFHILNDVQVVQKETDIGNQYAVYSVLINEILVKKDVSRASLNISNQTSSYDKGMNALFYSEEESFQKRIDFLKEQYSSVAEDTLSDFERKRFKSVKISPRLDIPVQYNLVTEKDVEKNGGRAVTQLISLSRIGFNQDQSQAFVMIDYFCPLCGFGKCILLEKQNGVWQVKEEFRGWVS